MPDNDPAPKTFRVVVPPSQQGRFLRGQCFAFAIMLRRHLAAHGINGKLYGLFEDADCHHAFVKVKDKAYDCRGEMAFTPEAIGEGSIIGDIGEIKPVTATYLRQNYDVDLSNIKREINRYVIFG